MAVQTRMVVRVEMVRELLRGPAVSMEVGEWVENQWVMQDRVAQTAEQEEGHREGA